MYEKLHQLPEYYTMFAGEIFFSRIGQPPHYPLPPTPMSALSLHVKLRTTVYPFSCIQSTLRHMQHSIVLTRSAEYVVTGYG